MTFDETSRKVVNAVEGVGGRFAIISLLSIIAGTSSWMLKSEIDQGTQLTVLVERMLNIQNQLTARQTKILAPTR